jgi:metal-sulfur cluster biosynthetic enzyme
MRTRISLITLLTSIGSRDAFRIEVQIPGRNERMDEVETRNQAAEQPTPAEHGTEAASGEGVPTSEQVYEALKNVYDPELGINIVDLGLVYDVEVSATGDVHIEYTLTTMGCPIGPLIEQQMEALLAGVPGVNAVDTEMVLRPAWSPEMMSEEAKAALGYF